jgi:ribokinase
MPSRIVVAGSINMDLVVRSPRHPLPGETLIGGPFVTVPGGKGANQSMAAARMGSQVAFIGCVGRDAFGAELRGNLQAAGIATNQVRAVPEATGVALITVSADGENTIIVAPGANDALSPAMIEAAEDVIAGADALLLQLEVPATAVAAAAALARRHGVPVILNPAPAQPLPSGLLELISFLIPNEHEAALLTGMPVTNLAEAEAAARCLQSQGAAQVILTLGSQGALALTPDGAVHIPSFPIRAVDSTAAGDGFLGAFAVALTEGRPVVEAASWGCAAGALACTVLGAQPSLPGRQAVEALLATR